jgi:hypothetical protein
MFAAEAKIEATEERVFKAIDLLQDPVIRYSV